jgi:hypothetical protein
MKQPRLEIILNLETYHLTIGGDVPCLDCALDMVRRAADQIKHQLDTGTNGQRVTPVTVIPPGVMGRG